MTRRWWALLLVVMLGPVSGCWASGSITHLIPDGYTGPVVIVFDDAKGVLPKRDHAGGIVYEIPRDGVLRLITPPPNPGVYKVTYFYVSPDGKRQKIPLDADDGVLQIFADVSGATGAEGGGKPIRWAAYIVGIANERDDWAKLRGEATSRAIGVPGAL